MENAAPQPKASFQPEVDQHTRILILGSLPGEVSLAAGQYYANPRNQFWRLTGALINRDLVALPYPDRLSVLREHRIGLWDVVGTAHRAGSLDTNIRLIEANPLVDLIATLPELRVVAFNGGKAATLGEAVLRGVDGVARLALPSSSPAYTLSFESKWQSWMRLRPYLSDNPE